MFAFGCKIHSYATVLLRPNIPCDSYLIDILCLTISLNDGKRSLKIKSLTIRLKWWKRYILYNWFSASSFELTTQARSSVGFQVRINCLSSELIEVCKNMGVFFFFFFLCSSLGSLSWEPWIIILKLASFWSYVFYILHASAHDFKLPVTQEHQFALFSRCWIRYKKIWSHVQERCIHQKSMHRSL